MPTRLVLDEESCARPQCCFSVRGCDAARTGSFFRRGNAMKSALAIIAAFGFCFSAGCGSEEIQKLTTKYEKEINELNSKIKDLQKDVGIKEESLKQLNDK